jgi:hypothetical protein
MDLTTMSHFLRMLWHCVPVAVKRECPLTCTARHGAANAMSSAPTESRTDHCLWSSAKG